MPGEGAMLRVVDSRRTVRDVETIFAAVAARHGFGVLGLHNLRERMNAKGIPFDRDVLVFEVCSPAQAKKVLEVRMEVSTALPCRIAVYEHDGRTRIATLKPTELIALFGEPALRPVAEEVERALDRILDDLA